MIVPERTKMQGDTCLEDTIKRFYKQYQEEPDKWDEPLLRAKMLVGFYSYVDTEYLTYYQAVLAIIETQETTPAPIKIDTRGGNITNSIRR